MEPLCVWNHRVLFVEIDLDDTGDGDRFTVIRQLRRTAGRIEAGHNIEHGKITNTQGTVVGCWNVREPQPAVETVGEAQFRTWTASGVRLDRYDDEKDFADEINTAFGAETDFIENNDEVVAVWTYEGSGHIITETEDTDGTKWFTAWGSAEAHTSSVKEGAENWLWNNDVKGA